MNKNSVLALVVAALVFGFDPRPADAGPVTWHFSGVIDDFFDPDNELNGAITEGVPFSGSFTFESGTVDSRPADPRVGRYDDAVIAISGQIGDLPFSGSNGLDSLIAVTNFGPTVNEADIFGLEASPVRLSNIDFIFSLFFNGDSTLFSGDSLPLVPPDFARGRVDLTPFPQGGGASRVGMGGPPPGGHSGAALGGAIGHCRVGDNPAASPLRCACSIGDCSGCGMLAGR